MSKNLKTYAKPEVSEQELNMAKLLINSMDTPFAPGKYKDEYQVRLRELIESKISAKDRSCRPDSDIKVIDLMEALKASVENVKKGKEQRNLYD